MHLRIRPVWVLALVVLVVLALMEEASVKSFHAVDVEAARQRAQLRARVDSLDVLVRRLESDPWPR